MDDVSSGRLHTLKVIIKIAVSAALFLLIVIIAAANYVPDLSALGVPRSVITYVVEPVQSAFSGITGSVSDYLRRLKLRSTLEEAYEELRAENEQLTYQAMLADEL